MKKFYFILIGIALLLAMSCSHDVNTTDTTDNSDNSSEPCNFSVPSSEFFPKTDNPFNSAEGIKALP